MRRCDAGCKTAPAQRMDIRRRGQWQTEERLLLPGYVCRWEYTALFMLFRLGVIRWLGFLWRAVQALDTRETLRWRLDIEETLEPSRVLLISRTAHGMYWTGRWRRLQAARCGWSDGSAGRMMTAELGGVARRVVRRYPRDGGSGP